MSGVSLNREPGHHRGRLRLRLATGDIMHCRHGCRWLVGRMLLCWGTPAQAEAVTTRIVHVWVPAGSEVVGREPVSTLVTLDVVHGSARNNGNALTAGVLAATVAHCQHHIRDEARLDERCSRQWTRAHVSVQCGTHGRMVADRYSHGRHFVLFVLGRSVKDGLCHWRVHEQAIDIDSLDGGVRGGQHTREAIHVGLGRVV